jgi:DtxR family transcriptional regulator, Mn-dependent transcriptional regulator
MAKAKKLSSSMEDYLETIFHIVQEKGAARTKTIARRLGVSYSSVTGAMQALAQKGLINYAPYDVVTLTAQGKIAAKEVIRRHEVLKEFFVRVLHAEEAEAEEGACSMEHSVPRSILERLIQYIDFLEVCPRAGTEWLQEFGYFCDRAGKRDDCERCMTDCLKGIKKQQDGRAKRTPGRSLIGLQPGQRGRIVKIRGKVASHPKIAEIGLRPGNVIEVEDVAPEGDPMDVRVKGYHIRLKKEEMEGITVALA